MLNVKCYKEMNGEVGKKNTEEFRPKVWLTCSNTEQLNFFKMNDPKNLKSVADT